MPVKRNLPSAFAPITPPDLSKVPARVDRRRAADLLEQYFFPVSPRTLEVWPLAWRHVNGKAVCETAELFALARAKLEAAPVIRGGRRAALRTA